MGIVVRAGLIIGGLLLMFVGIILSLSILLILFGMFVGFIGFIMLLVGLFSSTSERVVVTSSPQVTIYGKDNAPYTKFCHRCGEKNQEYARFCFACGRTFSQSTSRFSEEQSQKVLAICNKCKSRIPSESKFCPECGENLQPIK